MAGYSGTPLPQKLGIKEGMRIIAIGAPENYRKLLSKLPDDVEFSNKPNLDAQFIHFFVTRRSDLEKQLPRLRKTLAHNGTLWISWPKKSAQCRGGRVARDPNNCGRHGRPYINRARIETDMTEDVIRAVALPLGLVDVKVCAVDETWSGLKLMIRREQRTSKK